MLRIDNLKKYFYHQNRKIKAVDGVSIEVKDKSTVALVGESGCGKTTVAKTVLGFYNPDSGNILYKDKDISGQRKNKKFLCENIQIVFQNPYSSFDPRYTIFNSLYEAISSFRKISKSAAESIIVQRVIDVGLDETALLKFPHQLSGGQLQRISVARALIVEPKLVILDEPTSALDVTTAVKIIELLQGLKAMFSLQFLFISHDLKLVRKISDYIYVMYKGKIVEHGKTDLIFSNPKHPYTRLLLRASQYKVEKIFENKESSNSQCSFVKRCSLKDNSCFEKISLQKIEDEHFVLCGKPLK